MKRMKIFKSKKGYNTLITLVALIFIALVFVAFILLFKNKMKNSEPINAEHFTSIDTEFALRSFLNSNSRVNPRDVGIGIGAHVTNAQLASLSCRQINSIAYNKFIENSKSFLDRMYKDTWRLEIIYRTSIIDDSGEEAYEPIYDGISLGSSKFTISSVMGRYRTFNDKISSGATATEERRVLYEIEAKGSQVAMQYLPCKEDDTMQKIVLLLSKEPDGLVVAK